MPRAGPEIGAVEVLTLERVRRNDVREDGNEQQENDVREADDSGAVLHEPMPRVTPQARWTPHRHRRVERGGPSGHRYRIRGSRKPYDRPTRRFTEGMSRAKTGT